MPLRLHNPEEYIRVCFGVAVLLEMVKTAVTQLAFHAMTAVSS